MMLSPLSSQVKIALKAAHPIFTTIQLTLCWSNVWRSNGSTHRIANCRKSAEMKKLNKF